MRSLNEWHHRVLYLKDDAINTGYWLRRTQGYCFAGRFVLSPCVEGATSGHSEVPISENRHPQSFQYYKFHHFCVGQRSSLLGQKPT